MAENEAIKLVERNLLVAFYYCRKNITGELLK